MSLCKIQNTDGNSILIAEDSPVQASILKYLLEENGYAVSVARTGLQALDILREGSFTLIISDINMPEMDGYELCSTIKSDGNFKDIPVILLTSLSDPTDIIRGLQSGADNFITKPYEDQYLLSRIEHLMVNSRLRKFGKGGISLEIIFRGERYSINSDRQQILDLLISVFETAVEKNEKLLKTQESQYHLIEKMAEKNIELLETYEKLEKATASLKEQKQSLIREKERSNAIISSIVDGIIVTDVDQRIIMMNRAAEEFLGINFKDVENEFIDNVIRDSSLREKMNYIIDKLKNTYDFDFRCESGGNGPEKTMHGKTSLIVDSDEKRQGTVTVISDVTSEREIDRMKTEFLSTAAHELRTPLTSIQGFSEILMTRENLTDEDRARFLSYINRQAIKLAHIVNDLLDIARIESGQGFVMDKNFHDVKQCFEEVIPYFTSVSSEHRIRLNIPYTSVICFVDKDKVEQVLKNLISNSIKYSPAGGEITISGEVKGDFFSITVEDNGIGMTPDQLKNVFNKFYRVDSSDSAPEGTGLGMTIVKYLVEAHGGKVYVESEFGKGTKVVFTIALHDTEKNK